MKQIEGGVTAPQGFEAAGVYAGIKYKNRNDMALVYSKTPCVAAGVFTRNVVKAAPVIWDRKIIDTHDVMHGVVINAGIANACTGEEGMGYCKVTAVAAGKVFGVAPESIAVASTGVIGMQLPIDKIIAGVELLKAAKGSDLEHGHIAARSIMTTDTKPKEIAFEFVVGGKTAHIGGMCKGSGMIHPNMCTMLCFITTDVAISKDLLTKALRENVEDTFNMISVDGDTSTNDTVLLLANGEAENDKITEVGDDYVIFCTALHGVMKSLSKMIASDGEGCTCLFECQVKHADTKANARKLAKSVITSSLTKAAIFGHDANWGRILCALGYSGVDFNPEKVGIILKSCAGELKIVDNGVGTGYSEEKATEILSQEYVSAICDMNNGEEEATAWGCDLTYDYVKINGDYRS
jgi:glutamate N-acetyltransferase/amino-acid N-acetyltransferase